MPDPRQIAVMPAVFANASNQLPRPAEEKQARRRFEKSSLAARGISTTT